MHKHLRENIEDHNLRGKQWWRIKAQGIEKCNVTSMATPKISLLKASVMNHRPIKCQMQILGKYLRNKLDPVNSCPRVRRGDMKINKTRALGMTIHLKARSEGVCVMKVSG